MSHDAYGGGGERGVDKNSWKTSTNPILLSMFPSKLRACHVYQYIFTSANCVHVLYAAVFIISGAAGF
jgi:hypothetical protein